MVARHWTVLVVDPKRFDAHIIADVLRAAYVQRLRVSYDPAEALSILETYPADVVIAPYDSEPVNGAAWTRVFRRNHALMNRKASIFLTSYAFSRQIAEECRHAGANALIGKPLSSKTLLATINKVLARPRQFIDNEGDRYVGPCRRAGIVTVAAQDRRRGSDAELVQLAAERQALDKLMASLRGALRAVAGDPRKLQECLATLTAIQEHAALAADDALLRACSVFSLHLTTRGLNPDAAQAGLKTCVEGIEEIAALDVAYASRRNAVAEGMREAVMKAALQRAA